MNEPSIRQDVQRYYTSKLAEHGPTPRGVDWNSAGSQALRFEQLLCLFELTEPSSILDYGCGYGAMLDHLRGSGWSGSYTGLDVSREMVAAAEALHSDDGEFIVALEAECSFDHVVASGIFNVRLGHDLDAWGGYVKDTLFAIDRLATRGWSVNMLTEYSDADRIRDDLYYASPSAYFDFCMSNFSRKVAILHDYELFEFTLVVKR